MYHSIFCPQKFTNPNITEFQKSSPKHCKKSNKNIKQTYPPAWLEWSCFQALPLNSTQLDDQYEEKSSEKIKMQIKFLKTNNHNFDVERGNQWNIIFQET